MGLCSLSPVYSTYIDSSSVGASLSLSLSLSCWPLASDREPVETSAGPSGMLVRSATGARSLGLLTMDEVMIYRQN